MPEEAPTQSERVVVGCLLLLWIPVWIALASCAMLHRHALRRETTDYRWNISTFLGAALEGVRIILPSLVVTAFWPIYLVAYMLCPCIRRRMRNIYNDMYQPFKGRVAGQYDQDISHWGRRGWLVLLRARHQRIVAAIRCSRLRRAFYGHHQRDVDDLLLIMEAELFYLKGHDLEGGQWRLARDITVFQCRQLLKRVVEYEEDGVFRNIVEYV